MSNSKSFVFLDTQNNPDQQLTVRLQQALKDRGASVEQISLVDNYDAVLDCLQQGAVPVVIKA